MNAVGTTTPPFHPAGAAAWMLLVIAWLCFLIPFPGLGLFIGWPLNLVAFILAIVAMSSGGVTRGLAPLLLSLMVSPMVYFVGIAIFAGTLSAVSAPREDAHAAETESEAISVLADTIELAAQQLYLDYQANEIAADVLYKGKPLVISGDVEAIQGDSLDQPVVHLSAGPDARVLLMGLTTTDAAGLRKGEAITAACTGDGMARETPAMRHCDLR